MNSHYERLVLARGVCFPVTARKQVPRCARDDKPNEMSPYSASLERLALSFDLSRLRRVSFVLAFDGGDLLHPSLVAPAREWRGQPFVHDLAGHIFANGVGSQR